MQKPRVVQWNSDSGRMSLLPERGRVLQVALGEHDAFWVNPQWTGDWNAGGDRLWLAPELAWFWQTSKSIDWSRYQVPASVDPGCWRVVAQQPGFCKVQQHCRVRHQQRRGSVEVEVTRAFTQLHLPAQPGLARWVAYQSDTELHVRAGNRGQAVGIWQLLQVPPGGEMLFPCRATPRFRQHFGTIPQSFWKRTGRLFTCRITGDQQFKIGLAPDLVTGRLAYARPVQGGRLVILREFRPQSWRAYCDRPMSAPATQGDAVQVYNDCGAAGGFGEMEYHSPALTVGQGNDHLQDTTLTIVGFVRTDDWAAWRRKWLR